VFGVIGYSIDGGRRDVGGGLKNLNKGKGKGGGGLPRRLRKDYNFLEPTVSQGSTGIALCRATGRGFGGVSLVDAMLVFLLRETRVSTGRGPHDLIPHKGKGRELFGKISE